jgi:hypothetical protein
VVDYRLGKMLKYLLDNDAHVRKGRVGGYDLIGARRTRQVQVAFLVGDEKTTYPGRFVFDPANQFRGLAGGQTADNEDERRRVVSDLLQSARPSVGGGDGAQLWHRVEQTAQSIAPGSRFANEEDHQRITFRP